MSSRDKKYDDDEETPASWIAKRSPSYRVSRLLNTSSADVRRRSDTNESGLIRDGQQYHQSTQHWQPQHTQSSASRSWKKEKGSKHRHQEEEDGMSCLNFCDSEDKRSCPAVTARLPQSKPVRRMSLLLLAVLALGYFCWRQAVGPIMGAEWDIKEGFLRTFRGTYGFAMGGDYDIAQNRVVELDPSLIPGGVADLHGKRRLVFVGDIHGCKDELHALLKACSFDQERDHLIATGDVISKGPDSPGVIDELIRLNATSVRGNHEDRVLTLAGVNADADINQAKDVTTDANKDTRLLKSLHGRHIDYLKHMPLILHIPPLPLTHSLSKHDKHETLTSEILVVHAGLVPAVPLRKQDPFYVMNMRSLGRRTHVPSSRSASKDDHTLPWFELWNWYHGRLDKGEVLRGWHQPDIELSHNDEPITWSSRFQRMFDVGAYLGRRRPRSQVVVYGHDSKAGLMDKRWSKGLDSGCVKGGELTALVLDARGRTELISVKCKDHVR